MYILYQIGYVNQLVLVKILIVNYFLICLGTLKV